MALQSSGAISLSEIQTEFGGENPISISEYYGEGTLPASGEISFSNFYGQSAAIIIDLTISSSLSRQNWNIWEWAVSQAGTNYVEGETTINVTVNSGVSIYQGTVSKTAFTVVVSGIPTGDTFNLTIYGGVYGAGGNGGNGAVVSGSSLVSVATGGTDAGDAIGVDANDGTFNLTLAGGGIYGGGGGGGAGGAGIRQQCSKRGCTLYYYNGCGGGGGAGQGLGGTGQASGNNASIASAGAGGVWTYSGNGGYGGSLGSNGGAGYGSNHSNTSAAYGSYGGTFGNAIAGFANIDNFTFTGGTYTQVQNSYP